MGCLRFIGNAIGLTSLGLVLLNVFGYIVDSPRATLPGEDEKKIAGYHFQDVSYSDAKEKLLRLVHEPLTVDNAESRMRAIFK